MMIPVPSEVKMKFLGGIYFQHLSNHGMTGPKPGMDAAGFTIGCACKFW